MAMAIPRAEVGNSGFQSQKLVDFYLEISKGLESSIEITIKFLVNGPKNDIQEFFFGKKRTNLMVVRPILPVVELPIEGGKQQLKTLIKTSTFPPLFIF